MNPTHFQLDFQIMHYEVILRYRNRSHMILYGYSTGSHLTGSFIRLRVACYYSVSNDSWKEIFFCFGNGKHCTNGLC